MEIRVLDRSTGIPGGYASKLFTDAGAEVVKVADDPLREYGASEATIGHLFTYLHTGQEVVDGAPDVGGFDIVIDSSGEPQTSLWLAANPSLVILSVTPYGLTGPWAGRAATDFTLMAQSGAMASNREVGRDPLVPGGRQSEWLGGSLAAVAALAAVRRARATGVGDLVDVSMFEAVMENCINHGPTWAQLTGLIRVDPLKETPGIEQTRTGHVGFCIFTAQQWQDFALMIGQPDLAVDPAYASMGERNRHSDEIRDLVEAYTLQRTLDEVLAEATDFRVPAAPIGHGGNVTQVEQLAARGVYSTHFTLGVPVPRPPYRVTRGSIDPAAAPPPAPRFDADDLPLSGLRILDLTAFWAGPYAGYVLANLGADVIKVESVQRPDGIRFASARAPGDADWWEFGPTYHGTNGDKRAITLDLTRPEGRELLLQLVEQSDGLIENYSPRVMEQFDLGWDVLSARNPRLVMVRMPAFGLDGPWRDRVGFAQTMEQLSGIVWMTGYADGDPRNPRACADPLTGLHAAFAMLRCLDERQRTGVGSFVEATMVEAVLNITAEQVIEHAVTGTVMTRNGNEVAGFEQGVHPVADHPDGTLGLVAVSTGSEAQRAALRDILGDDSLDQWCGTRAMADVIDTLASAGVPVGVVAESREGNLHPQLADFYQMVEHPIAGPVLMPTLPVRFDRGPKRTVTRPAPTLGQHNADVLGSLLGLDDTELDRLTREKIIGTRPGGA